MLANSKPKDSVRKETAVVSDTKRMCTPCSEPLNEMFGEQVRAKELCVVAVRLGSHLDRFAGSTSKVIAQLHLAFTRVSRIPNKVGSKFGDKCALTHRHAEEQPSKKPKKEWLQKCVARIERCTTLGRSTSGRRAAEVFNELTEEHKSLETKKKRARFTKATRSHPKIQEEECPSLGKNCPADPCGVVRTHQNSRTAMRPRRCVETGQKYL